MNLLLEAHSIVRWFVVAVTVVALVWFALRWLGEAAESRADRPLMSAFTGLIDLQTLLGITLLLWLGFAGQGFPRHRIEHGVTMLIAVVLAHLPVRWRRVPSRLRARNNFFIILAVLVLIFAGISRLPQGWFG